MEDYSWNDNLADQGEWKEEILVPLEKFDQMDCCFFFVLMEVRWILFCYWFILDLIFFLEKKKSFPSILTS